MRVPALYLITDRSLVPDLPAAVSAVLGAASPGRVAVQLREKDLEGRALLDLARALRPICAARGAPLLVNGRLDVVRAAGADGVHLPANGVPVAEARRWLGPQAWIGASCHSEAEVIRARDGGADFATFGPVFETRSKAAYGAPVGLPALARAARLGLPLVALGGISSGRALSAREAGATGLGAIRAFLDASELTALLAIS
jgi:thiamine-phosphate pyrophosphorylase